MPRTEHSGAKKILVTLIFLFTHLTKPVFKKLVPGLQIFTHFFLFEICFKKAESGSE